MTADLPPTPILALEISNALLHLFGFGPSQSICRPFARCHDTLRAELAELPWWQDRLTETALGQTRMSDNAGRRSARRKDIAPGESIVFTRKANNE